MDEQLGLIEIETDDRITIGSHSPSHENVDLRSGFPLLGVVPGPVLNGAHGIIFFHLFSYQQPHSEPTAICLSRGGVLCTFGLFSCRGASCHTLSSPSLICQLLRVLTPHRLGSATGRPRRLVTLVPSFPRAKQHHARNAESE